MPVQALTQTATEAATGFGLLGAGAMAFRTDPLGVLLFVLLTACMVLLRTHPRVRGGTV
jgi:hypothetical protein